MGVIGAVSDGKDPKASGKEMEVYDHNCQADTVSSHATSGLVMGFIGSSKVI